MRKITDQDIEQATTAFQNRIAERALRRIYKEGKESGVTFSAISDDLTTAEAEALVAQAITDELSGLPMPPPLPSEMAALDGFLNKIKNALNKVTNKFAKAVHKTMKRIAPALLGGIIGMIAGPAAGTIVGKAIGSVASKYVGKKQQANEIQRIMQKAMAKAAVKSGPSQLLPIGVTPEQARTIASGKLPGGMDAEQVWHTVEQAKLIQNEKMTPEAAYVAHYHSYGQDAPPLRFVPPIYWDFVEKLKYIKDLVQKENRIPAEIIKEMRAHPAFKVFIPEGTSILSLPKTLAELLRSSSKAEVQKRLNEARAMESKDIIKAKYPNMTYEQYVSQKRLIQSQIKKADDIMKLNGFINQISNAYKSFPGEPYDKKVRDLTPETVTAEDKKIAVKAVIDPKTTEAVITQAKQKLAEQGINIESPEAQNLLKLQIEQLQQQVADAVAQGKQLPPQVITIREPAVRVVEKPDGEKVVQVEKEESNMLPLLLGAGALLLMLKGG